MNTLTELSGAASTGVQEMVADIVSSSPSGLIIEN